MTYREGPASRKRVRCERHFLAYDPSATTGCVLCRRTDPAGATASLLRTLVRSSTVLGLFGVSIWGALNLAESLMPRARAGEPCSSSRGCVEDYDCLSFGGFQPPVGQRTGRCIRACSTDADCTAPERCTNRGAGPHCGLVAGHGEACGGAVSCPYDADCLAPPDSPSEGRCRKRCDTFLAVPCPAGQTCIAIATTYAPALPAIDLPGGPQTYCVPASPAR